jgi:hypothetical protein
VNEESLKPPTTRLGWKGEKLVSQSRKYL